MGAVRTEVRFESHGDTCAAWLFRPDGPAVGSTPLVVMAHGLGAVKELGLAPFAERFCAAGLAALALDYRSFGESGGQPRQLLSVARQREDLRAAIAFARTLPGIDPQRIALWGTSFGGGHAMVLAAEPALDLRCAVAQCPFTFGPASALRVGVISSIKLVGLAVADGVGSLLGAAPVRCRLIGAPGDAALMTAPDAIPGYLALRPEGFVVDEEVAARVALQIPFEMPGRHLARAACPVLVAVCTQDSVAPAGPTLRYAARAPRAEVITYPVGHFDIYRGAPFEAAVADEVAFLVRHLGQNG